MAALLSGWGFVFVGIVLTVGGAWLAALGGSVYYLFAAAGFLTSGTLLIRRRKAALPVHAAIVSGTLLWAWWEVGLDVWRLMPRCAVITLLGLWLLSPWIRDRLETSRTRWQTASLGVSLAAAILVMIVASFSEPHDITGRLPQASARSTANGDVPPGDWPAYGRTLAGQRYSPLDRITPDNVDRLQVAWIYHTGDARPEEGAYELTPLKVGDSVYLCTPAGDVIALDADTGKPRWRFVPQIAEERAKHHPACRGVSYHAGPRDAPPTKACIRRLFTITPDARLVALDAETGRRCETFGDAGTIDLTANLATHSPGFIYSASPPVVTRHLVIVNGAVHDDDAATDPSGVVRAYAVDTGQLVWNWDPGNPGDTTPLPPAATYVNNTPKSWSIASADEALGMIYLPMGSQLPAHWGANRGRHAERFSTAIVALDLATGQVRWVFQTVHHDLWDMDVPAQPSLVDLSTEAGQVPALVAPTKQGDIYVLDRRNGEPILPVSEVDVPEGALGGDETSTTQPVSRLSLAPPPLTERDMWGATLFDQLFCRIQFRSLDYEGRYTPPSTDGTLVYPGNLGVFNWGGIAVDPLRQVAFTTPSYLAFVLRLIPRGNATDTRPAEAQGAGDAPFTASNEPFLSPLGLPCQAPPWGYVAGVDLRGGDVVWRHKNGTVRDRTPLPLPFAMGVPDLGGPVMTAGGVAFISGTLDQYVRAYDVTTGEELWKARLPAGGQATPMTYLDSQDRQMVLVVAGGHGALGTRAGDAVIAYVLPGQ